MAVSKFFPCPHPGSLRIVKGIAKKEATRKLEKKWLHKLPQ